MNKTTWFDCDRDAYSNIANAKERLETLKKCYPLTVYRIIQRTIVDKVVK